MLGLRHVVLNSKRDFCFCLVLDTWEKSETRSSMDPLWEDQLKSVALIRVTSDLTSQYKITRLTWLGD